MHFEFWKFLCASIYGKVTMLLNVQYGTDSLLTTTNSSRLQLKSSRAKKKDCITEFGHTHIFCL